MATKYIELAFDRIAFRSTSAVLFDMGEDKPIWIPKSVINMKEFDTDSHVVPVAEWWAGHEGLL